MRRNQEQQFFNLNTLVRLLAGFSVLIVFACLRKKDPELSSEKSYVFPIKKEKQNTVVDYGVPHIDFIPRHDVPSSEFLVCYDDNKKNNRVSCMASSERVQTQFMDGVSACTDAKAWMEVDDSSKIMVETYGDTPILYHDCFLKNFFSSLIAIYQKNPQKSISCDLQELLEDAVICQGVGNLFTTVAAEKKDEDAFNKCLEDGPDKADYISPFEISHFTFPAKRFRDYPKFQACFFEVKKAAAVLPIRVSTPGNIYEKRMKPYEYTYDQMRIL